jgi:hypothetical protein
MAFDRAMNPVLRDCVALHPQAGHHAPGPLVFPNAMIASLTIETLLSPPPSSGSIGAHLVALFSHPMSSAPPPPTDWVVDSGASFHTAPTSSLSPPILPTPLILSSIFVGNGSTLLVTSVGDSVFLGPFYLNDVLVAPHMIQPLLLVRPFTTDNCCPM